MCAPLAAVGAAVGSELISGNAQKSAARAQSALDAQVFDLTLKSAAASFAHQGQTVRARQRAETDALVAEIEGFALEGVRTKGRNVAQAAESGGAGRTITEANLDVERSVNVGRARASTLSEYRAAGAERELEALLLQAEGRAINAIPSAVRGPSGLEIGISAAAAGASTYSLFI